MLNKLLLLLLDSCIKCTRRARYNLRAERNSSQAKGEHIIIFSNVFLCMCKYD